MWSIIGKTARRLVSNLKGRTSLVNVSVYRQSADWREETARPEPRSQSIYAFGYEDCIPSSREVDRGQCHLAGV